MTNTAITPALQRVLDTASRHAAAAEALDAAYREYRTDPTTSNSDAWIARSVDYKVENRAFVEALVAVHATPKAVTP